MKKSTIIRKIKRALKQYKIDLIFDNENESILINKVQKFNSELEYRLCMTFDLNTTSLYFNKNKKQLIIEY
jgi:hypothetical protein